MFYDKFVELCERKGIKPTPAALAMGLSKSTPTKWKNTGATPDVKTLAVIAEYFGVPVSSLVEADSGKLQDSIDGVAFDDFTFAAHNYSGKLTEEDKATVLKMMAALAAANKGGKNGQAGGDLQ